MRENVATPVKLAGSLQAYVRGRFRFGLISLYYRKFGTDFVTLQSAIEIHSSLPIFTHSLILTTIGLTLLAYQRNFDSLID